MRMASSRVWHEMASLRIKDKVILGSAAGDVYLCGAGQGGGPRVAW
jgi:hypothetical protein